MTEDGNWKKLALDTAGQLEEYRKLHEETMAEQNKEIHGLREESRRLEETIRALHIVVGRTGTECAKAMNAKLDQEERADKEKESRVRYQDIVYAVCNFLDTELGNSPTRGAGLLAEKEEVLMSLRKVCHRHLDKRDDGDRFKVAVERISLILPRDPVGALQVALEELAYKE